MSTVAPSPLLGPTLVLSPPNPRPVASVLLAALMLTSLAVGAADTGPRRVLVIHSFGREYAPFTAISSVFRTELARRHPGPLQLHEAALEGALNAEGNREEPVVEYLRTLMEGRDLHLVVAFGNPAVQFRLRHLPRLFPDTPTLLAAVDARHLQQIDLGTNIAAVPFSIDLPGALEHLVRLRPDTTRIAVVIGRSPVEQFWEAQSRQEFQAFTNRLAIEWWSGLSLDGMVAEARRLPPQAALLYGALALDAAGVPFEQDRALQVLHAESPVPIFGFFDHLLGRGIVGGPLLPIQELGAATAQTAADLLQGAAPSDHRPPAVGPSHLVYDWRELRRFNISDDRLPPGSEVRFRAPTFWEQYRWPVGLAAGFVVVESALVVALLAQLRRRRHAEAVLRDREQRLSLATSAARVGVWSWDFASGAIEATAESRSIFGFAPDQPITFELFEARVHPEDRPSVREAIDAALRDGTVYDHRYRIVRPDQQVRWISARGTCQPENGPARAMMGVLVDITEACTAEQQAAQHQAEMAHLTRVNTLSGLSGSLAHELNQPLSIILSNAQAARHLLGQPAPDVKELREILDDIIDADRRAGDLIQRLRALLKRGEVSLQPLSLNELLQEVLQLARADLLQRGVVVTTSPAQDLPMVLGDRIQLQQLVLNLVVNAADAMATLPPGSRRIHLGTATDADTVSLTVRDEGIGLPAEADRVFQPFYTTKPHGLGMGLAICQSIARAHQGALRAEPHPERGAVFRLELPVAAAEGS